MGCGCEIYGQQVVNPNSTNPVQSTPSPRGGNAAVFVVDVLEFLSSAVLTITIEHKNSEETSWSSAGSFSGISTAGVYSRHLTGLKESVRWSFALGAGVAAGDMYRVQKSVSWLPY